MTFLRGSASARCWAQMKEVGSNSCFRTLVQHLQYNLLVSNSECCQTPVEAENWMLSHRSFLLGAFELLYKDVWVHWPQLL